VRGPIIGYDGEGAPMRLDAGQCSLCAGTGSPFRARVELAAYAGSEAARAAVGAPILVAPALPPLPCPGSEGSWHAAPHGACFCGYGYDAHVNPDKNPRLARELGLGAFLRGLSLWADVGPAPGWVLVRAAVAAARVALPEWEIQNVDEFDYQEPGGAWRSASVVGDAPRRAIEAAEAWLACPCEEHLGAWHDACVAQDGNALVPVWVPYPNIHDYFGQRRGCALDAHERIAAASHLAGEAPVLNAIRSSLIEWSLGGER
jgi:hypothetical protein